MHVVVKFKNRHILYFYLLFLFIIGSCTMSNSGDPEDEDNMIEDIDEDDNPSDDLDLFYEAEMSNDYDLSDDFDDLDLSNESDQSEISDEDSENYPDISGIWAKIMILYGRTKPPLVSPPIAWAVNVLRTEIIQNGSEITTNNKMCRLKVGNDNPIIEAVMPDSFADSLVPVTKKATLTYEDDGTVSFNQDKIWDVRSCTLDNPENDLPTEVDDPRVEDWDNSGMNGMKMGSSGVVNGWAEIVQKASTILNGTIQKNGEIRGLITWAEQQKVLWTDNFAMAQGSPTYQDGDPTESYFIYKTINPSWDCLTIRLKSAEIFPESALKYPEEFK